ncbi:MAG: sigma-54 dependent transcriptional regulator [Candidatus Eisenbacteria bacterium]
MSILVIDDDKIIRDSCRQVLSRSKYSTEVAGDGPEGLELMKREVFDIVVLDLKLPSMDGLDVLKRIESDSPDTIVIVITGYATVESAVQAMKLGAYDFVPKPFTPDELRAVVRRAAEKRRLTAENIYLRDQLDAYVGLDEIIGESKPMATIKELIRRVGPTDSTVLISGESGTGKDVVARAIHYHSAQKDTPFVVVDCGGIVPTLFESELFGHVRGAFTGAVFSRKGKLELANEGTVFFDEIGNIDMNTQGKLLRVIQEREITRVGSNQTVKIEVRIVSATNKDLGLAIKDETFREDLFYRLSVIPIYLPPLRQRKDDIALLAAYFLDKCSRKKSKKIKGMSREAMQELRRYDWPGNVRELQNTIERAVVLAKRDIIGPSDLFYYPIGETPGTRDPSFASLEKEHLTKILEECTYNKTKAAALLEIDRKTLRARIKKYGIPDRGETPHD